MKKLILFLLLIPALAWGGEPIEIARMNPYILGSSVPASSVAITVDATALKDGDDSEDTITWSHTISGSNPLLVVSVYHSAAQTITGITWNTTENLTKAYYANYVGTVPHDTWYIVPSTTGTHDIVVTFSATTAYPFGISVSFNGVHQTVPVDVGDTASGDSTAPSVAIDSTAGDLVIDTVSSIRSDTAPDASQTLLKENALDTAWIRMSSELATGASTTMSWTQTSGYWAIGGIALKRANP